MMKRLEHGLELLIFNSRWLLAPIYVGLVLSILLLLLKFVQELVHVVGGMFKASEGDVILAVLTLVDLSLVANLLLIVLFSGYENFVSKIHTEAHEDRPEWMGKVDFSGLKLKLVASIVAISGIELLKALVNIGSDRMGPGLLASRKRTLSADGSRFAFSSPSATDQHWPALPPDPPRSVIRWPPQ